jgi:hypothetical protein
MNFAQSPPPPETGGPNLQSVEETGLPWFRTWPSVYIVVTASFIFWVILLVALYQMFS